MTITTPSTCRSSFTVPRSLGYQWGAGASRGLLFDNASSQYCNSGEAPSDVTFPYSMSCWIKPDDLTSGMTAFACVDGQDVRNTITLGFSTTNDQALGQHNDPTVFHNGFSATNSWTTADVWHHLACVVTGTATTGKTLYFDGTSVDTEWTGSGSDADPEAEWEDILIGARRDTAGFGNYASGLIKECAFWSIGLSAANVTALAAGVKPSLVGSEPPIVYQPLDGDVNTKGFIGPTFSKNNF